MIIEVYLSQIQVYQNLKVKRVKFDKEKQNVNLGESLVWIWACHIQM